tara:strand:- start:312 stop:497 length:186 start_codon:yes stop_codon:yes gene_type:complete
MEKAYNALLKKQIEIQELYHDHIEQIREQLWLLVDSNNVRKDLDHFADNLRPLDESEDDDE